MLAYSKLSGMIRVVCRRQRVIAPGQYPARNRARRPARACDCPPLDEAAALAFLRALRGLRLAGADVVEVSPAYDGPGQQTALAAANVAWELLALHAVSSA